MYEAISMLRLALDTLDKLPVSREITTIKRRIVNAIKLIEKDLASIQEGSYQF